MEVTQSAVEAQNSQIPLRKNKELKMKQQTNHQTPTASRFTRSQLAPDWTMQEMLVLVNEFAAVNNGCLKWLPSYQKWKMISDSMEALHMMRSSNQCQRKWDSLLSEYKKIKAWESQSRACSYWCMESERKKDFGLPAFFDRELFELMDVPLKIRRTRTNSEMDSDSQRHPRKIKVSILDDTGGPGSKEEVHSRTQESNESQEQDMARKLQESAQLIRAILNGELTECVGGSCSLTGVEVKTEHVRRQADELIKVFGTLVSSLNQFTELVKESE